jgi:hypothetical protein
MVSFQGKYQILSALGDGETQSFRALQISSARPVLVHHLTASRTPSPQPDLASLIFRFLRTATAEESRHFLDMGEDEGRIYVVTADVPECLDLRKWLQSVADAHADKKEVGAPPAAEGTPDSRNLAFTRAFTTEALRQVSRSEGSVAAPPSAEPRPASPAAPLTEESPGVVKPPPEIPAAPSEVHDSGSTEFTAFWEKSLKAQVAGQPASIPAPPPPLEGVGGPSAELLAAPPSAPTPEKSPGILIPPAETHGAPSEIADSGGTEFTAFWEKSSRAQAAGQPASAPTPPAPLEDLEGPPTEPLATLPTAPPPEKKPGVLIPPPEIPAPSSEGAHSGPTDFSSLWEKSSPANLVGQPASIDALPASQKSPDGPSAVPEVTEVYSSRRSALNVQDAPTEAMTTLRARAERERALAQISSPAEAQGAAGHFADLILAPPESMKPHVGPAVGEVSITSLQPAETPASPDPETKIPQALTGLLVDKDNASAQAAAPASTLGTDDKQGAEGKGEEKGPRRQIPMGFEVVFQSSKARSRPTWPGPQEQSGIMTAPESSALPAEAEAAVPAPAAGLPNIAPLAVGPPAEKVGGGPALSFPDSPGPQRPAVATRKEPSAAPLPPLMGRAVPESEKATRPVPTPPAPPTGNIKAPADDSPVLPRGAPRVSAPPPPPPSRGQPGEYTRMIENVRALAGPLPPVGPPVVSPPPYRPAANSEVPASAPARATHLHVPVPQPPEAPPPFQPSVYVALDKPVHSAGRKRKVWVPILILSSLFLMTVALLLFFAIKP